MTILTLNGFLGLRNDWSFLDNSLTNKIFHHFDIYDRSVFAHEKGLWDAGKKINKFAENIPGEKILMGYSLGGRLALHALIENPKLWKAAVIISANPGLECELEKQLRLENDITWADRFLYQPWKHVLASWNAQEIFNGHILTRNELDFTKISLSNTLKEWSLGKQQNLCEDLKKITIPIFWITGENDNRFTSIAKKLELLDSLSKKCVIKNAAHRVPWEQQTVFIDELKQFLIEIKKEKI